MKTFKIYFFIIVLPLMAFTTAHKYYLSLTQIDYKEDASAVQITMNVFMDDAEVALNKTYNKTFKLNSVHEPAETNKYFEAYLLEHFKIKVNGESTTYNFLGKEYEGDVIYFYMEIENIKDVKSMEIENTMLMQYFPEQQNYIKLKIKGEFESLLLTKKNNKGLLNF